MSFTAARSDVAASDALLETYTFVCKYSFRNKIAWR